MRKREKTLMDSWGSDPIKIGNLTIYPPSPYRLNHLLRRDNSMVGCENNNQTELEGVAEAMFVLSRDKGELSNYGRLSKTDWDKLVDNFFESLEHTDIEEFSKHMRKINESLEAAQVEELEKPGKPS